jgi:hypothetical protein
VERIVTHLQDKRRDVRVESGDGVVRGAPLAAVVLRSSFRITAGQGNRDRRPVAYAHFRIPLVRLLLPHVVPA